ncbi:hypothetical protein BKE38_12590 [Pseudoroseomonas deserti]|uniref:Uncharacterized protein n=1 Tax=Teichococcus deserti TaxID=1817963 RepID=A0A1V2H383_9PROT|nr:hypothetical protein [Pseudoroseomonas deserti]ONG53293.1 hypothetical protein BKE38_12590 [Pseudoroseomonas deserti]
MSDLKNSTADFTDDGAWMRSQLERIGETQAGLARFLQRNGDNRELTNIERSIRRMTAGDARVSGEMRAILGILRKRHERAAYQAQFLDWDDVDGVPTATTHDGYTLRITPQKGSRWLAQVDHHGTGYSVTFRPWEASVEKAKAVAMSMLDEARRRPETGR